MKLFISEHFDVYSSKSKNDYSTSKTKRRLLEDRFPSVEPFDLENLVEKLN
jgi:hypothetical protein